MSTYEELKKKRDAAVKAFQKADATLTKTNEEFRPVLLAHLASLPDGWYAEPDWLDEDGFDIEVIPLADVKF